jgi:Zn finger protein HypA/HybF involved in hydrogenase expression
MALFGQNVVKARCKRCGNEAPATDFRMHYDYKMMVCPTCFKGGAKVIPKVENKVLPKKEEEPQIPKAPGWDKDDEYLERAVKFKKEKEGGIFKQIPGTSQLMCTCPACKYSFRYDPVRKIPHGCPYCNGPIPRVSTFSLC